MSEKAAKSEVPGDFLFENRSLVDFQIGNERKGRQIGGSSWFPNREWAKRPTNRRFQVISYLKIYQWFIFKEGNKRKGRQMGGSRWFPIWKSISGPWSTWKHFLSVSARHEKTWSISARDSACHEKHENNTGTYRYTVIRECMVYTCTWKDEHVVFGKRHASQNNFAVLAFIPKSWQAGPDFCFQLVTSRISVIWCFVQYSRWANFVW